MKITIDFGHPYFEQEIIFALTPPASFDLAEFYIDKALAWNETPEYRKWKDFIDKGN